MRKLTLFLITLGVFWLAGLQGYGLSDSKERLVRDLAQGFVKATKREARIWWECGEQTPVDQWDTRAEYMARQLVAAMDDYRADFSPWGVWAVIWAESRGNRCAVGPYPRRYARQEKLAELPDKYYLWTENDVRGLVNSPRWGNRPVDLGLGQVVWKRFARIPCEQQIPVYWNPLAGRTTLGGLAQVTRTGCRLEAGRKVRVPTLDEMISVAGGVRVTTWGMVARQSWSTKRNKTPWLYWPGMVANYKYLSMIVDVVANMGGPIREVVSSY